MKTEIKHYIMNKYLSFTENEDRIYSNPSSPLEARDSEYSFRQRLRNMVEGKHIVREKKVNSDENQIHKAINKTQDEVNTHAKKSKQKYTDNEVAAIRRSGNQVAEDSDKKNSHASHKRIIEKAKQQAEKATGVSSKQSAKNVKINKERRNKWAEGQKAAHVAKHAGKATVGGAVVGGALGVGAGHLASSSARKELAALHTRGINSQEDHARADKLRKKISNAKLAGGAIGAVGGLIAARKINKNIAHKKAAAHIKGHVRNGSADYKKEATNKSIKYM